MKPGRPGGFTITQQHKNKISKSMKGKTNALKVGHKIRGRNGYILIYSPTHPFRDKRKYVYEHRLVVEQSINRFLLPEEVIHHINNNRSDNRIENLKIYKNCSEHMKNYHKLVRELTEKHFNFSISTNLT